MVLDHPMFSQFSAHDQAITEWFERQGWPVTIRDYDMDRDVFAWRHEKPKANRTLRITLTTVEDYPPNQLVNLLDVAKAAGTVANNNTKYVVVGRQQNGSVGLDVLDEAPPL